MIDMTVEQLKTILKNIPNGAELTADCEKIKKVVATLNDDGDIISVNLVL